MSEPREGELNVYGTVVPSRIFHLTDDSIAEATRVEGNGAYGVVVFRKGTESYVIERCEDADYRDNVLVPFHAYYDYVDVIHRFGPSGDH